MTHKIFILYSSNYFEQVEEIIEEVGRELGDVECGASSFSDRDASLGLASKFLDRGLKYIDESVVVYILGSRPYFQSSVMSQLARVALDANKAICITMPDTKKFPHWYPQPQAVKLFTRIEMVDSAFKKLVKLTESFLI